MWHKDIHFFMMNGKDNLAQYEFIPWILSNCSCIIEAKELLAKINLTDTPFQKMPVAQLHWMLADKEQAITVEAVADGIKIYPNPIGVLTNNPPFPEQVFRLNDFMNLSAKQPKNHFSDKLNLHPYSFFLSICKSCVRKGTFCFRSFRTGKRQSIFPHSRFGGTAKWVLRGGKWSI